MALTDAENTAISSILTGGVEEPLTEQPGAEEKPVELAMFGKAGGTAGTWLTKMLFGQDLFKSRQILDDLKTGKREALKLEDMFLDPEAPAEKSVTIPKFLRGVEDKDAGGKADLKKPTEEQFNQFQEERLSDAKPIKGLLTDFRVQGAAGDDKIPNEQSVINSIEAISKTQSAEIERIKRGKMSDDVVGELADLVGLSPNALKKRILGRKKGEAITVKGFGISEVMLASRTLMVEEIKKLDELAELAASGGDQALISFRQQFELVGQLQAQIKGSKTEIARALAQFRIPTRNEQFNRLRNQDASLLLDEFGGSDAIKDIAKNYLQLGKDNLSAKAQFTRGRKGVFGKVADMAYEVWINALLSSPVTHTKNVVGAFLTTFGHVPEVYVAAGMGAMRRKLRGQTGGVEFGEANAALFGAVMAYQEAWNVARLAYKTGEKPILGSKLEMTKGQRHSSAFSQDVTGVMGTMGNAVAGLGKFATLGGVPTSMLEFEDTYFKVVAQRMSLYQQAYRQSKQRGLGVDDSAEFIANYVHNPPENATMTANAHAQYVTLQQEVDVVGKQLKGIRNVPTLRYFIPFFKTPYNAFKYAFAERTPLGVLSANMRETLAAGTRPNATPDQKAARDMAVARMSMGSVTLAIVALYTWTGRITGAGPADREHNRTLRRQNWKPYSVRIGDEYVSYLGFEPFSSVMSMAADLSETLAVYKKGSASYEEMYTAGLLAFSNQLTDKTFMQGFSNFVSLMQDPTRYAKGVTNNFARSLVPRAVAQVEKMVDPTVRQTNSIIDEIRSQIPGLSATLPPERNIYGQAQIQQGALGPDIFSPMYSNTVGPNTLSIDPETLKIGGRKFELNTEQDINDAYEFDKEFATIGYGPRELPTEIHEEVSLTNEERDLMHRLMGDMTLTRLRKYFGKKSTMRRYEERKKLYLETGNKIALERMERELNREINAARDTILDIDGFGYGGLFFKTELGKQFKQRLDDYNDKSKAAMKAVR